MTITEFFNEKYKNRTDKDNIYGVGMTDAEFRKFIIDYLLPDDWCISDPLGQTQINELAIYEILEKHSKKFRKERKLNKKIKKILRKNTDTTNITVGKDSKNGKDYFYADIIYDNDKKRCPDICNAENIIKDADKTKVIEKANAIAKQYDLPIHYVGLDRKDIIITDNNYDEEWERLCDAHGWKYSRESKFVDELPEGFSENKDKENCDDYDYSKVSFEPNVAVGCTSAIENYETAWKFKNGFMIVYDRDSMFD